MQSSPPESPLEANTVEPFASIDITVEFSATRSESLKACVLVSHSPRLMLTIAPGQSLADSMNAWANRSASDVALLIEFRLKKTRCACGAISCTVSMSIVVSSS